MFSESSKFGFLLLKIKIVVLGRFYLWACPSTPYISLFYALFFSFFGNHFFLLFFTLNLDFFLGLIWFGAVAIFTVGGGYCLIKKKNGGFWANYAWTGTVLNLKFSWSNVFRLSLDLVLRFCNLIEFGQCDFLAENICSSFASIEFVISMC